MSGAAPNGPAKYHKHPAAVSQIAFHSKERMPVMSATRKIPASKISPSVYTKRIILILVTPPTPNTSRRRLFAEWQQRLEALLSQVAEVNLPGSPLGTPMTYWVGGKQYIALTPTEGRMISLSLP